MNSLIIAMVLTASKLSPPEKIHTSDLHLFPVCPAYTSSVVDRIDKHRKQLKEMQKKVHTEAWMEDWFTAVDDTLKERRKPWFCLAQAQQRRACGDVEGALEWLGLLQQTLSPQDYYSGNLPEPIPVWAYLEKK